MKTNISSPIIIIGTHRSGTSILTKILNEAGLFIGKDLNHHYESKQFLRFNDSILHQFNSSWHSPQNAIDALSHHSTVESTSIDLSKKLRRIKHRFTFFGITNQRNQLWGWKDPRNVITFNIWKQLFPQATYIHIVRHGIDVALSLSNRETKRHQGSKFAAPQLKDPSAAFQLWESYEQENLKHLSSLPSEKVIRLKYEDLIQDPITVFEKLLTQLSILPFSNFKTPTSLHEVERKTRHEKEFTQYFDKHKESLILQQLGYSSIG